MAGGQVGPVHIWRLRVEEAPSGAGAHGALRRILAEWTGRGADELVFDRTCEHCGDPKHGRPVLAGGGPAFSLSRTRGITVIAVVDAPAVGIDIEAVEQAETWEAVREDYFTRAERVEFTPARAARWWARKEAVAKALGLGMALAFGETDVRGETEWVQVSAAGARPIVRDLPGLAPGHAVAVALREPPERSLVLEPDLSAG